MYNKNQETGICMPLLVGYTQPNKIQEIESEEPVLYDPIRQIAIIHPFIMRTVGTRSLRSSSTNVSPTRKKTDRKNEIDDSKKVK